VFCWKSGERKKDWISQSAAELSIKKRTRIYFSFSFSTFSRSLTNTIHVSIHHKLKHVCYFPKNAKIYFYFIFFVEMKLLLLFNFSPQVYLEWPFERSWLIPKFLCDLKWLDWQVYVENKSFLSEKIQQRFGKNIIKCRIGKDERND